MKKIQIKNWNNKTNSKKHIFCCVKTIFKDVWGFMRQFRSCVLRGPLSPQTSCPVCTSPGLWVSRPSTLSFLIKIRFKFMQEAPTTLTGRPLLVRQVFHQKGCGSLISEFLYLIGPATCRDISYSLIKIFYLGQ